MLFQRDQAEKKELTDTSVNNTVIDGDSNIQSVDVSFSKQREHQIMESVGNSSM